MFSEVRNRAKKAGSPPGKAEYTGAKIADTVISCTIYSPTEFDEISAASLDDCFKPTKVDQIKWINVEGLSDVNLIKQITQHFDVHPLTLEDILNVEQRPKVEEFETYIFVTL